MDRDTATPTVSSFPAQRAQDWRDAHHQHAAPSTYVYPFVWDVTAAAEGPFCTDIDGNILMDFTSHVAAAPLGYNNPKLMDRVEDIGLVDPLKIAGQDFYVAGGQTPANPQFPGPTQLMDRLTDVTAHYDMDTVFLSNSGAEAVENAIKIAYADRAAHRGVCFDGAFHGRTLGALSLNRSKAVHRKGYPEVPGVISVPYCACDDYATCTCGWRTDGHGGNVLADKLHPEYGVIDPAEVAYVILEPMQGEGGYRPANPEFLAELDRLCTAYDINLICDEIQTGLGRSGEMWASDHFDLTPDVLTSAKALRVGATIANEDVFPDETARLSSTWGAGDILNSMLGALTLDVIEDHDLCDNAAAQGRNLRQRLRDLDADWVTDVRGMGLLVGIEFDTPDHRDAVRDAALAGGLLTLGCGEKTLRLLPPLDVTDREIELAVDIVADAIAAA